MKNIIIIGGGTAGTIIAEKLAKNSNIMIFEASENKSIPLINKIPLLIGLLYKKSNKYIKRINISNDEQRMIPYYASNVLGGASETNGAVHVVGLKEIWSKTLEKYQLKIDDLVKEYQKIYSKNLERNKINITTAYMSELDKRIFETLAKQNIPLKNNEWIEEVGCTAIYNTAKRIFRSTVRNYKGKDKKGSIEIKLNEKIKNIIINDDKTVVGVISDKKHYYADYIIISAGVVGTGALLAQETYNDQKKTYNGSVGSKKIQIKDHGNLRINIKSKNKIESLNAIQKKTFKQITLFAKHMFGMKTIMIGTGATSAINLDFDGDGIVDTRIHLLNFYENGRMGSDGVIFSNNEPGFSFSITQINPRSSGEMSVNNGNIDINPKYLSDVYDIEIYEKAIKFILKTLKEEPIKNYVDQIINLEELELKPRKYIQENIFSGYHLIGGSSILIDENFMVKDYRNLYICDASVLEEYPSSNIHSSVVLLGAMFAEKLNEKINEIN